MNNKNTSIIFTIALVAGIIGISPTLSAYAQGGAVTGGAGGASTGGLRAGGDGSAGNNICQNVNIVQSTNILDVDNTNTNTNTGAAVAAANPNEPFQQQDKNNKLTPDNILDALFGNNGNGESPLNFDDRFGCVSVNTNDVNSNLEQEANQLNEGGD
jgi:hypothetical protein